MKVFRSPYVDFSGPAMVLLYFVILCCMLAVPYILRWCEDKKKTEKLNIESEEAKRDPIESLNSSEGDVTKCRCCEELSLDQKWLRLIRKSGRHQNGLCTVPKSLSLDKKFFETIHNFHMFDMECMLQFCHHQFTYHPENVVVFLLTITRTKKYNRIMKKLEGQSLFVFLSLYLRIFLHFPKKWPRVYYESLSNPLLQKLLIRCLTGNPSQYDVHEPRFCFSTKKIVYKIADALCTSMLLTEEVYFSVKNSRLLFQSIPKLYHNGLLDTDMICSIVKIWHTSETEPISELDPSFANFVREHIESHKLNHYLEHNTCVACAADQRRKNLESMCEHHKFRHCVVCGANHGKYCESCKSILYCSRKCQKADAKNHLPICETLQEWELTKPASRKRSKGMSNYFQSFDRHEQRYGKRKGSQISS